MMKKLLTLLIAVAFCQLTLTEPKCKSPKQLSPRYLVNHDGHPRMRFAVINRSTQISCSLLKRVLNVVAKQATRDFAPFYGIDAEFEIFSDNKQPCDWSKFVPLIFVDFLTDQGAEVVFNATSVHSVQSQAIQSAFTLWANAIDTFITNPPAIPDGQPYIVIPIGSPAVGYGVAWAFSVGFPFNSPSFEATLSITVSETVLNTLWDPTVNLWTTNFGNGETATEFNMYINEVTTPVFRTAGYTLPCDPALNVSNFVLPNYWDPYGTSFAPFDFLNTVTAPFTPHSGLQQFIKVNNMCLVELFVSVSRPSNPNNIITVDAGPVLAPPIEGALNLNKNNQVLAKKTRGLVISDKYFTEKK